MNIEIATYLLYLAISIALTVWVASEDLTAISDQGAVYFGPKAWLMVLWTLCRYRDWSYRLASPELLPTTRRVVSLVSQHRYQISRAAGLSR